jgi:hypothetical protein
MSPATVLSAKIRTGEFDTGGWASWQGGSRMARIYAALVGIVLLLLGLLGLLLGNELLLGVVNIDVLEDLVHLASGALLLYARVQHSAGVTRGIVGAASLVYLLVGLLGFVIPYLFGLLPHGYSIVDNAVHLVLGMLGLLIYANSRLPGPERGAADPRA